MAEANISVDLDQLNCSICLELLKDPATIPCGHSFCIVCITHCWDTGDSKCPHCRHIFTPRPVLGKNYILAEMVERLKESGVQREPITDECFSGSGDVPCGICVNRKRKAEKSCLVCLDSYCQIHFRKHEELHPEKKHKVVDATEIKDSICSEHGKLMEVFCRTDQKCICLSCVTCQHKGHDIISVEAGKNEKKLELKARFQLQIQERERELQALKDIVEPLKSSAQETAEKSETIIADLVKQIRLKCSNTLQLIIDQSVTECVRALELADKVEEVLDDLKKRDNELEHLPETNDHVPTLQSLLSLAKDKTLARISINENLSFHSLMFDLEKLKKNVIDDFENEFQLFQSKVQGVFLEAKTRKEMLNYSTKLTLDKFTAFRKHQLSEDNTKVTWSDEPLSFGERRRRFTKCKQVLCDEELSDRAYWEVEWNGGGGISIAVAYKRMNRNGYVSESGFGNNEDSWALQCYTSNFVFRHDGNERTLSAPIAEYVGVYLDHKAGLLAFYSVSNNVATLLHKVHTTFTAPLIPGFYVDSWSELKICNKYSKRY